MHSDPFEQAFSQFLDRYEYDKAEQALFDIVRSAFLAGWEASGGNVWSAQKIVRLLPQEKEQD